MVPASDQQEIIRDLKAVFAELQHQRRRGEIEATRDRAMFLNEIDNLNRRVSRLERQQMATHDDKSSIEQRQWTALKDPPSARPHTDSSNSSKKVDMSLHEHATSQQTDDDLKTLLSKLCLCNIDGHDCEIPICLKGHHRANTQCTGSCRRHATFGLFIRNPEQHAQKYENLEDCPRAHDLRESRLKLLGNHDQACSSTLHWAKYGLKNSPKKDPSCDKCKRLGQIRKFCPEILPELKGNFCVACQQLGQPTQRCFHVHPDLATKGFQASQKTCAHWAKYGHLI
ncbi:hypothetical protein IWX49DRAFT_618149 [Phyllosticta citricarpa]